MPDDCQACWSNDDPRFCQGCVNSDAFHAFLRSQMAQKKVESADALCVGCFFSETFNGDICGICGLS